MSRSRYWPTGGANPIVKSVLFNYVTCKRFRKEAYEQIMGQLLPERTLISKPFSTVGIDFADYFVTRCAAHHSYRYCKSYLSIFICFATRVVYVEVVSDLTTACFVAALQRFIARRGLSNCVYSDNATNFTGVKNLSLATNNELNSYAANEGVRWIYIPSRSPNYVGLQEAAVKFIKHYLPRISIGSVFSFEELNTLSARIEAMLNDRPLCYRMNTDDTYDVLILAHFLIGSKLHELPNEEQLVASLGQRWSEILRIQQAVWRRWRCDYLAQLQVKSKQTKVQENPKKGDIVLLKDEVRNILDWPMGVILQVFPDRGDKVRIVEVRTTNGLKRRCASKLIPLVSADHVY